VIGVAQRQGESMASIFDIDNSVFIPLGFGEIIGGIGGGGAIAIAPAVGVDPVVVADEVRSLVRSRRGLAPDEEDDFSINRMSYLSDAVDDLFRTINLVGWIIGGFALLIGAFGIANILFVSVRERMPQIGIQKALGAKNYLILIQFLTESAVLSLVGGSLGILIVVIISLFLEGNSPIPFELTVVSVIEGVVIALVVGVLSGLVPAYSAAKMDPVKAINM
jgi:putative ABC transport system permease protein